MPKSDVTIVIDQHDGAAGVWFAYADPGEAKCHVKGAMSL